MSHRLKRRVPNPFFWSEFTFNPVGFVTEVLGATPQDWQVAALNSIYDPANIRNAIKACHGPGKTAVAAWMILHWICTRPYPRIPCTAPTEHQLHDKLWPELHKWHRQSRAELWRWFEWEKTRYFLREKSQEWFAVARVARVHKVGALGAEAWGMQGFHSDHLLFLIDEASGVDDAVYGAVEGALSTDTEVKVVALGNPNIPAGWFYNAFTKHTDIWNTRTVSYLDSPKVSNKWAEEMIATYGIDHPWVQVRVLGEFPGLVENGLFTMDMIIKAQQQKVESSREISLGIDVARYGDSRTLFCISAGGEVQGLKSYRGLDLEEVALEAEYVAREIRAKYVVVDSDGVGAGATDILKRLLRDSQIKLIEWHGSSKANDSGRFSNTRSELFWKLRDALANRRISLPESDTILRQATAIRYNFDNVGRIRLERKEEVKKMIGESPDEIDSISYSLAPFLYEGVLPCRTVLTAEELIF